MLWKRSRIFFTSVYNYAKPLAHTLAMYLKSGSSSDLNVALSYWIRINLQFSYIQCEKQIWKSRFVAIDPNALKYDKIWSNHNCLWFFIRFSSSMCFYVLQEGNFSFSWSSLISCQRTMNLRKIQMIFQGSLSWKVLLTPPATRVAWDHRKNQRTLYSRTQSQRRVYSTDRDCWSWYGSRVRCSGWQHWRRFDHRSPAQVWYHRTFKKKKVAKAISRLGRKENKSRRVIIQKDWVIQLRSRQLVPGRAQGVENRTHRLGLWSPQNWFHNNSPFWWQIVLSEQATGMIPVELYNPTDESIHIFKNTTLGLLSPLGEITDVQLKMWNNSQYCWMSHSSSRNQQSSKDEEKMIQESSQVLNAQQMFEYRQLVEEYRDISTKNEPWENRCCFAWYQDDMIQSSNSIKEFQ